MSSISTRANSSKDSGEIAFEMSFLSAKQLFKYGAALNYFEPLADVCDESTFHQNSLQIVGVSNVHSNLWSETFLRVCRAGHRAIQMRPNFLSATDESHTSWVTDPSETIRQNSPWNRLGDWSPLESRLHRASCWCIRAPKHRLEGFL